MYPVSLGYQGAVDKIENLHSDAYYVEALLASVFTVEKTMKRALRALVRFRGFPSTHADNIVGRYGFRDMKEA